MTDETNWGRHANNAFNEFSFFYVRHIFITPLKFTTC